MSQSQMSQSQMSKVKKPKVNKNNLTNREEIQEDIQDRQITKYIKKSKDTQETREDKTSLTLLEKENASFLGDILNIFKKEKISIDVKENPSIENLMEIEKEDKFIFKFNNKSKGTYIECHKDEDYYIDFYKTFGKPQIYGLYEKNNETKEKTIIGTLTLNYRYDTKVCQIMDLKIKKAYRGKGGVNKFINSSLISRIMKNNGYYGICMNTNTIIESIINKIMLPKMKDRGKMLIYLISYDEMNKILSILSSFYCSEIAFIDNNKTRMFVSTETKKPFKILHLHHNADYREEVDFTDLQRGYQYCFSIHESNEYIIKELKDKYKIASSSSATIYSNDFKTDWSKFVKTFEI